MTPWHFLETKAVSKITQNNGWFMNWASNAGKLSAIQNEKPSFYVYASGAMAIDKQEELRKLIISKVKYLGADFSATERQSYHYFASDEGAAYVDTVGGRLNIEVMHQDQKFILEMQEFLYKNLSEQDKSSKGNVYVLCSENDEISYQKLGYAAVPVDFDNYAPAIHTQISRVIANITEKNPTGRISILEGPPGSGKTYLLRGLVAAAPDCIFVFVPPPMIPRLCDVSLISCLLSLKNTSDHPTVLLCEDADSILTTRGMDNMDGITSVLNLSAGLLGDLIDVRIVATTNAKRTELDPAIIRSGRLGEIVKVPSLDNARATALFSKLTKKTLDFDALLLAQRKEREYAEGRDPDAIHLSEVYLLARANGWAPTSAQTAPVDTDTKSVFDIGRTNFSKFDADRRNKGSGRPWEW